MPETPVRGKSAPVNKKAVRKARPTQESGEEYEIPGFPGIPTWRWAKHFRVSDRTIRDWIDDYKIPYYEAGRDRLITVDDMIGHLPYRQPGKPKPLEE